MPPDPNPNRALHGCVVRPAPQSALPLSAQFPHSQGTVPDWSEVEGDSNAMQILTEPHDLRNPARVMMGPALHLEGKVMRIPHRGFLRLSTSSMRTQGRPLPRCSNLTEGGERCDAVLGSMGSTCPCQSRDGCYSCRAQPCWQCNKPLKQLWGQDPNYRLVRHHNVMRPKFKWAGVYFPALETLAAISEGHWLTSLSSRDTTVAQQSSSPNETRSTGRSSSSTLGEKILNAMEKVEGRSPLVEKAKEGGADAAAGTSPTEFLTWSPAEVLKSHWASLEIAKDHIAAKDHKDHHKRASVKVMQDFHTWSWKRNLRTIRERQRGVPPPHNGSPAEDEEKILSEVDTRALVLSNWAARAACGLSPLTGGYYAAPGAGKGVPAPASRVLPRFWDPDCEKLINQVAQAVDVRPRAKSSSRQPALEQQQQQPVDDSAAPASSESMFLTPHRVVARMLKPRVFVALSDHSFARTAKDFAQAARRLRALQDMVVVPSAAPEGKNGSLAQQHRLSASAVAHTLELHRNGGMSRETLSLFDANQLSEQAKILIARDRFHKDPRLLYWAQVGRAATGAEVGGGAVSRKERGPAQQIAPLSKATQQTRGTEVPGGSSVAIPKDQSVHCPSPYRELLRARPQQPSTQQTKPPARSPAEIVIPKDVLLRARPQTKRAEPSARPARQGGRNKLRPPQQPRVENPPVDASVFQFRSLGPVGEQKAPARATSPSDVPAEIIPPETELKTVVPAQRGPAGAEEGAGPLRAVAHSPLLTVEWIPFEKMAEEDLAEIVAAYTDQ